jgi:type VI secretion system secreted protein Hcp
MTHPALRPLLLALSIALLPAGAALAGNGMYLDIASIPGESTDAGHVGQIDVGSLSWGVSVAISRQSASTRAVGKPSVQDIAWMQGIDKSVLPLFSNTTSGVQEASARFEIVKPGTPKQAPYLTLAAEQQTISSMSFGGSSGTDAAVQATMSPAAVTLSYDPGALGGTGPALVTRYDLMNNTTTGPSGRQPDNEPGNSLARAGLYLRLGSGATAIAGDSRAVGYENWIAIDSFSMGTSSAAVPGGPMTSKPSVSELSWSQSLDATAPAVLFNLLKGQSIGQATIEKVVLDRSGRPVTVMQQALDDVLFSSFSLSTNDASSVSFAGSMSFSSFTQTLWPTLATGGRGSPFSFGFDVVNNVAIPGTLAVNVAGFGNGNLDGSAAPIPEPQTWLMMLAGIGLLAGAARRRAA